MTIPSSSQPTPIVSPNVARQFVDSGGMLTNTGRIALQQMHDYIVNMNRNFPCNAVTSGGFITLTMLPVQPTLTQYADYDKFAFVADATITAGGSACVVTTSGTLPTLKIFNSNGTSAVISGGIKSGLQYELTYADVLNSSAGGFVLR